MNLGIRELYKSARRKVHAIPPILCTHTENLIKVRPCYIILKVIVVVKCPKCGTESSDVVKEWNYSIYHVKNYMCKKCRKSFKAYFLEGKLNHTIPKSK